MIRVFVVDDSQICCELLSDQLEEDGDIEVIDIAASGVEALAKLAATNPDVVTVDLNMPGMDGLTLIETIMARDPRPIIVVTGLDARERDLAVAATERGALGLVNKVGPADAEASAALRESVRRLANVDVGEPAPRSSSSGSGAKWPAPRAADRHATPIVAFGSSAGGPKALFPVLDALPPQLPAALAVAHHLPPDFVSAFSRLLRSRIQFEVCIAHEPVEPEPGVLVLAPGGTDLVLEDGRLRSRAARPGALACPRVDVLFESLAGVAGAHVGVVLSGLGDDGSRGLAAMRDAGKLTIVQDRATATVWGMPRAALGSALEVLNTHEIDEAITRWLRKRGPSGRSG
ncbi:Chemotaxis response regulator protein-glutamate methylesterase [Enhygromyxa salina]|uniref:protein-glutamate methylesterase n=1 Tax=Enhygromyxa salina TaxID=215803 RepID=A0A2S9YG87_9BACT|nr:chemotaxis protein CheB [Enhygromyxa salina]PRQ04114.1 Chemotaxis response regulator protein-glutamate methylesterase [Enhygromyxa salina]